MVENVMENLKYLQNPLVFIGFIVFLFISFLTILVKTYKSRIDRYLKNIIISVITITFLSIVTAMIIGFANDGKNVTERLTPPIKPDSLTLDSKQEKDTTEFIADIPKITDRVQDSLAKDSLVVYIILNSQMENSRIYVDGEPAIVIKDYGSIVKILVESGRHTFTAVNEKNESCSKDQEINKEGDRVTPCVF